MQKALILRKNTKYTISSGVGLELGEGGWQTDKHDGK
jgi:hypothetical protein